MWKQPLSNHQAFIRNIPESRFSNLEGACGRSHLYNPNNWEGGAGGAEVQDLP